MSEFVCLLPINSVPLRSTRTCRIVNRHDPGSALVSNSFACYVEKLLFDESFESKNRNSEVSISRSVRQAKKQTKN